MRDAGRMIDRVQDLAVDVQLELRGRGEFPISSEDYAVFATVAIT